MDQITITEALMVGAMLNDRVDETNMIGAVRHAQAIVVEYAGGNNEALYTVRTVDEVDSILIMVTENGHRDIFFD